MGKRVVMYNYHVRQADVAICVFLDCQCVLCNNYYRRSEEYKPKTFLIPFIKLPFYVHPSTSSGRTGR
jgi:hypothetical protein